MDKKRQQELIEKMKYITVLDFEIGRVFQYKADLDVPWENEACEDYLTNKGHNLTNCEWMIHDIKEIVDPTKRRITN